MIERAPLNPHRTDMKYSLAILLAPLLTACVSIDLPGVVSDTAKVAKDTYKSVSSKKEGGEADKAVADASNSVFNTYIGQDTQTAAEMKKRCVDEAAAKLFKANGGELAYTVGESTVTTVNNAVAVHCRVTASKPVPPPAAAKQ